MRGTATRVGPVTSALGLVLLLGCGGGGGDAAGDEGGADLSNPLMNPAALNETAPDLFRARFETNKGDFVVEVHSDWSPAGADRFYSLVKSGYFDEVRFFRVIEGFMAQFGMHGDPYVTAAWRNHPIADDPVTQSNLRGFMTFAKTNAPDSRTTQVFINLVDNVNLDPLGFSPFGQVVEGMDVVDQLYSGYGEGAPAGQGPIQQNIAARGNEYLEEGFPTLDYVERAVIVGG